MVHQEPAERQVRQEPVAVRECLLLLLGQMALQEHLEHLVLREVQAHLKDRLAVRGHMAPLEQVAQVEV